MASDAARAPKKDRRVADEEGREAKVDWLEATRARRFPSLRTGRGFRGRSRPSIATHFPTARARPASPGTCIRSRAAKVTAFFEEQVEAIRAVDPARAQLAAAVASERKVSRHAGAMELQLKRAPRGSRAGRWPSASARRRSEGRRAVDAGRRPSHMQPPTSLPACLKGVQVMPAGHSAVEVHTWMPVNPPATTQAVDVIELAEFVQAVPEPRTMDAPGAQQTGCEAGQSVAGSAHAQSTPPAPHAVPVASQLLDPGDPKSQQCSTEGSQ